MTATTDLRLNFPILPDEAEMLAPALSKLASSAELQTALKVLTPEATPRARRITAAFLARDGWAPDPDSLFFTGCGKQAIGTAAAAVVGIGGRLGVEPLTYSYIKMSAPRLGITLVPVAMDEFGMRPDALEAAHREVPLQAIYVQPTIQNPTTVTMPAARRSELAAMLRRLDIPAIEESISGFLSTTSLPPLAALAPERTIFVDSLSTRLAMGVGVGFLSVPPTLREAVATAVRGGAWAAGGIALETCLRWMEDGTVAAVVAAKRKDAAARQAIARDRLGGLAGAQLRGDPGAYQVWLELSPPWNPNAFVAAAAARGVSVLPADFFMAEPGTPAPNAVRIALPDPPLETLTAAFDRLAAVLRDGPTKEKSHD